MILAFLLALGGLLMIYFEFFLPGGIMGAIGTILMILSVFILVYENIGPVFLFFYVGVLIISLIFCVRFALKRVKKTGASGTIYLDSDQAGFFASKYNKDLIGKTGIVSADLRPSGYIQVDGQYYQAVSKTGYLQKGTKIEVVGGQGARLICKHINKD